MKVLSIGNSFSQDAQRWLHLLAKEEGIDLYTQNLYIGGCSLQRHYNNLISDASVYALETNGDTGNTRNSSIMNALKSQNWDVITVQQLSQEAGRPESYEPYLGEILKVITQVCPNAKICFQETWEYEYCSGHGGFKYYENSGDLMYGSIHATVRKYASDYDLTVIPSGTAVHKAKKLFEFDTEHNTKAQSLYRDGFHMHLIYGRYLLACVWFKVLLDKNPTAVPLFIENADIRLLRMLQKSVESEK